MQTGKASELDTKEQFLSEIRRCRDAFFLWPLLWFVITGFVIGILIYIFGPSAGRIVFLWPFVFVIFGFRLPRATNICCPRCGKKALRTFPLMMKNVRCRWCDYPYEKGKAR
jgi:hypothetical protein